MPDAFQLDEDEALSNGELPTEDVLAMVNRDTTEHKEHNDSEDDQPEDDPTPPPTSRQALEAVRKLQEYFNSKDCTKGSLAVVGVNTFVTRLSTQTQTQSSLLDYFRKA